MSKAVRPAVRRHKLLGNPIAVAGTTENVVIIQSEDIVVDMDEDIPTWDEFA